MRKVHHAAICTRDVETSLRFWRDGLDFVVLMDREFDGDWPLLFGARSSRLRSIFLGDPATVDAGVVELVDFGSQGDGRPPGGEPTNGFFLLSVFADLDTVLARLQALGLGGEPRQIVAYGRRMAVVQDPNGVLVEIVDGEIVDTRG